MSDEMNDETNQDSSQPQPPSAFPGPEQAPLPFTSPAPQVSVPFGSPAAFPVRQPIGIHPLVDQYLRTLRKQRRWVSKKRNELFCQEVRGHLEEIAATVSGDDNTRYLMAIQRFGDANVIAGQFVEAYGYGKKYLVVMSLVGFFLGLLTIPLQIPFQPQTQALCFGLPTLVTVIIFVLIIRVSIKAGKRTGFVVGLSCGVSRLLALGILLALIASNPDVEDKISVPGGVVAGIVMVSLLMMLSGYLPGRTLQKYQEN